LEQIEATYQISDGIHTHLQYLASVAIHGSLICDLPQDLENHPQITAHDKHWINDVLTIHWGQLESISLTDHDMLNLPDKIPITFTDKFKVRHIVEHAYTVRIIIECGGLLWQISNNLIDSRRKQWIENAIIPQKTRILSKDKAEMPLQQQMDIRYRKELLLETESSENIKSDIQQRRKLQRSNSSGV